MLTPTLPDLNRLDREALLKLLVAEHDERVAIHQRLLARESEIEHTIVMERSQILDVPHRIEDSLIGRDVTLFRSHSKPKAYKMMLGDHSKVGIL